MTYKRMMRAVGGTLVVMGVVLGTTACGSRTGAKDSAPVVMQPMQNPPANAPANAQILDIQIVNGRFSQRIYTVQPGPVVLRVTATGTGPHSMRINQLLQARLLPVGQVTQIGLTTYPGDYTMMTDGGALDTATLQVRQVPVGPNVSPNGR